eukprot:scaffold4769_cov38-Prasinocladus_malaysianus.AAC.1
MFVPMMPTEQTSQQDNPTASGPAMFTPAAVNAGQDAEEDRPEQYGASVEEAGSLPPEGLDFVGSAAAANPLNKIFQASAHVRPWQLSVTNILMFHSETCQVELV